MERISIVKPSEKYYALHFKCQCQECLGILCIDYDFSLFEESDINVGSDINDQSLKLFTDTTTFTKVATSSPRKNSLCVFDGFRFHLHLGSSDWRSSSNKRSAIQIV